MVSATGTSDEAEWPAAAGTDKLSSIIGVGHVNDLSGVRVSRCSRRSVTSHPDLEEPGRPAAPGSTRAGAKVGSPRSQKVTGGNHVDMNTEVRVLPVFIHTAARLCQPPSNKDAEADHEAWPPGRHQECPCQPVQPSAHDAPGVSDESTT